MENVSDLAHLAQRGDLGAFQVLVKRFQDMAFTVAWLQLRDEMLAEDAAQESFIEAFLHIASLNQPEAFAGWLRRIVVRRCNRIRRTMQPEQTPIEAVAEFPASDPGPIEKLMGDERSQRIKEAIASLPEYQQTVTVLHYISGYSQNEIADFLEVPGATVRKRLQYAREQLKERLSDMKEEYFERRPSQGDEFGNRVRFFIAVRTGDVNEVQGLLNKDPKLVSEQERWSETLAELYPRAQPSELDRNARNEQISGWTALEWAVWFGDIEMARVLLKHGASPHHVDWRGASVLSVAVGEGHIEIVRLLIEQGVDPNGNGNSRQPIFTAIGEGSREMVECLVDLGADLNVRDKFGRTTLHWAAAAGHLEIVELLLKNDVDRELKDQNGRTAAWWATRSNQNAIAAILQEDASDMQGEDFAETTAVGVAIDAPQADSNHGVPIGREVLGRILNSVMQPMDDKGPLNAARAVRLELGGTGVGNTKAVQETPQTLYPLGIKPLDLFAPVPRNGILSLIAAWGVGKIVLLHELMRTMKVVKGGRSVVVTVTGGPRELEDVKSTYRETGVLDSSTIILIPKDAPLKDRRDAVLAGMTMACHAAEVESSDVLFAVDRLALDSGTVSMLRDLASGQAGSILTVLSGYYQDERDPDEVVMSVDSDARVVFSADLSRRGLYPAVDPLESWSNILDPAILGERHVQIAREVRELLSVARNLSEAKENPLTEAEAQIVGRAERVQQFLTQPFYVAQLYNGIPGEQVSVEDMLDNFARLLAGEYDHAPLKSLGYIGSLDGIGEGAEAE